mmetsp:Transcript_19475/g.42202  ORF Transcript_19475/g.42202 Transcript_19475/m.42202 type:complete len:251 (+) Transcript_19475:995-1747(+)
MRPSARAAPDWPPMPPVSMCASRAADRPLARLRKAPLLGSTMRSREDLSCDSARNCTSAGRPRLGRPTMLASSVTRCCSCSEGSASTICSRRLAAARSQGAAAAWAGTAAAPACCCCCCCCAMDAGLYTVRSCWTSRNEAVTTTRDWNWFWSACSLSASRARVSASMGPTAGLGPLTRATRPARTRPAALSSDTGSRGCTAAAAAATTSVELLPPRVAARPARRVTGTAGVLGCVLPVAPPGAAAASATA